MYCIRNNDTGSEYEVSPISMVLLRVSYPISYLLYGVLIVLVLSICGLQNEMITLALVAAYAIDILLRSIKKFTGVQLLFSILTFFILLPVWIKIAENDNKRFIFDENVAMDIYNEIERQKLRRKEKNLTIS